MKIPEPQYEIAKEEPITVEDVTQQGYDFYIFNDVIYSLLSEVMVNINSDRR